MPNIEMLEATMAAIKDNPEMHLQKMWATQTDCGTAYCFAGMACHLAGWEPLFQVLELDNTTAAFTKDGRVGVAQILATELLDLDPLEAAVLFMASNSVKKLESLVKSLANGEDITK